MERREHPSEDGREPIAFPGAPGYIVTLQMAQKKGEYPMIQSSREVMRHARMPINSAVFMMHGGDSWSSDMVDISATGVMVRRPFDWRGRLGEHYILDMMVGEELNIHLEATVARITDWHIGFAYERIPADKEVLLWNLLGGFADQVEPVTF
jgi:hypothetical protein